MKKECVNKKTLNALPNQAKLLATLEEIHEEVISKKERAIRDDLRKLKENSDRLDEKYRYKNKSLYYDDEGKPISSWEWRNYHSDPNYKIVAQDTLGPFFVSTVWLGIDYGVNLNSDPDYKPLIFETMIFGRREEEKEQIPHELDDYLDRYYTKEQALDGHAEACRVALQSAHDLCVDKSREK